MRSDITKKEKIMADLKATGVLPCIKLHEKPRDWITYAKAMYEGGARALEITMTTPGALEGIEAISSYFGGKMHVAAGTVLDAATAREVFLHGGEILVNPCVIEEVIDLGSRYQMPVFSGAFTATECFQAMRLGAAAVKIFPGALGGAAYMTNLKMVFPEANLIPSGGITPENCGDFIKAGAFAVSGARTFMNFEKIQKEGISWITEQVRTFVGLVGEAKKELPDIP
ncbi:MAG: bifunctional 4-hydroxy-2-oxoglutarate aldolase/2-dehydro-3-deoxy-phosphogluconate aldolase [Eubacteriales bacterium]|nr:bifunctional 4-hydroxy-2-oxoglutarate aldolase/2-dehydro-3-deoxy-phosphogluconate aldolase [Eubacteriales bacterium]